MLIKSLSKIYFQIISILLFLPLFVALSACGGGGEKESLSNNDGGSNKAPVINVISPSNGNSQSDLDPTILTASAIDEEDGDISSKIQWSSDIDGNLGSGSEISVQLSSGNHIITAAVVDSGDKSANDNISYIVSSANGVVSLSWTPPTENTDESELTNLIGFKVYYGNSETELTNSITVDSAVTFAIVIDRLRTEQTYYFAVTAVNQLGAESQLSNISSKFVQG